MKHAMRFFLASMLVGAALGMGDGGIRGAFFGDAGWVVISHDTMLGEGSIVTAKFDSSKFGGAGAGDSLGPVTGSTDPADDVTWAECITGPFKWHIHTIAGTAGFTGAACASANFGGHFNPTGLHYSAWCEGGANNSDNTACEAGGDWTTDVDDCSAAANAAGWAANCEVGDFSGKNGLWGVANANGAQWWDPTVTKAQLAKVTAGEGANSIVVHCTDGSRAMCAPLMDVTAEMNPTDFTADFGDAGSVTITEMAMTVELDAAGLAGLGPVQGSTDPADDVTWAECWGDTPTDGIKYHIHTNVNSETSVATDGPTAVAVGAGCAGTIAGGHFGGPALAAGYGCGDGTDKDETACGTAGAVWHKCAYPTSTQFATWMTAGAQDVDAMLAALNTTPASACEMGDLSGKFGKYVMGTKVSEAMPMLHGDFASMSIVFHCADGSRAFCTNMAVTVPAVVDPVVDEDPKTPDGGSAESPAAIYSAALAMLVALLW